MTKGSEYQFYVGEVHFPTIHYRNAVFGFRDRAGRYVALLHAVTRDPRDPNSAWPEDPQRYIVQIDRDKARLFYGNADNMVREMTLDAPFVPPAFFAAPLTLGARDSFVPLITILFGEIASAVLQKDLAASGALTGRVAATSTLAIILDDARVTDYWPNCSLACINAGIGARFNRQMMTATYQYGEDQGTHGVRVSTCEDETCANKTFVNSVSIDDQLSNEQTLILNLNPGDFFDTNTWYLVELTSTIKMIGGYRVTDVVTGAKEAIPGPGLQPFSWKFRTKTDSSPCVAETVDVDPLSFVALFVGERTDYTATPFGAPDACTPVGQRLNPWNFDWRWGADIPDPDVARVTNFSSARQSNPACTLNCLPKGSDIARGVGSDALCGNGTVDAGEDCDIGATGEVAGQSCSLNCLRPGNETPFSPVGDADNTCGNGTIEAAVGEECEPGVDSFCTDTCTWQGSSETLTRVLATPLCGSGEVTEGEECDTADPATRAGCSDSCLHLGTPLSRAWCDSYVGPDADVKLACESASTACGNGQLEDGEECEFFPDRNATIVRDRNTGEQKFVSGISSPDYCNASCLLQNVCGTDLETDQCAEGDPGCASDCTLGGSSITYSEPSFCGDGVVGTGEYRRCELEPDAAGDRFGLPEQIVEAVGESREVDLSTQSQSTEVHATVAGFMAADGSNTPLLPSAQADGSGDYFLQCSYEEYEEPVVGLYNNCPSADFGVGVNSCCYPRPTRVEQYPAEDAPDVCRNTAIEVQFRALIDERTVTTDTIFIAEEIGDCSTEPGEPVLEDVTSLLRSVLAYAGESGQTEPSGFWPRIWEGIKHFFVRLLGQFVNAVSPDDSIVWCKGAVTSTPNVFYEYAADGESVTTTISLQLEEPLKPETHYAVVLRGGLEGIKDDFGVGIKNADPANSVLDDGWWFKTGTDICKIAAVTVDPDSWLFTKPFATSTFSAVASSTRGVIQSTSAYGWEWSWIPGWSAGNVEPLNPIFEIPAREYLHTSTTRNTVLGARNLEGTLGAYAKATVVADLDPNSSQEGLSFTGKTDLSAFFCDSIWPVESGRIGRGWAPFTVTQYNFSMSYCADAGAPATTTDDLPLLVQGLELSVGTPTGEGLPEGTRKRYLFFNEKNDDVIGIQIFENPERLSAGEWYAERYDNLAEFQQITIHDYDAITNGTNYYVNAFNEVERGSPSKLFNNIYHFSINEGAQQLTREAFERLVDSLRFNINILDIGYCLVPSDALPGYSTDFSAVACRTDFDCRDDQGSPTSTTNGVCGNGRTKLLRDWKRLNDIRRIQDAVEATGGVPNLAGGTFYPGYTVSKWPSWNNTLGRALTAALPQDQINQWTACASPLGEEKSGVDAFTCWDAASSTYNCPTFSSVYEYEYVSTTRSYKIHAPLEYISLTAPLNAAVPPFPVIKEFIDVSKFADTPWCSNSIENPFAGACGDRVVQRNAGEQCDPPGSVGIGRIGIEEVAPVGVCTDDTLRACSSNPACNSSLIGVGENPGYLLGESSELPSDYPPMLVPIAADYGAIQQVRSETVCTYGTNKQIIYQSLDANRILDVFVCSTDTDCRSAPMYGLPTYNLIRTIGEESNASSVDVFLSGTGEVKRISNTELLPNGGATPITVLEYNCDQIEDSLSFTSEYLAVGTSCDLPTGVVYNEVDCGSERATWDCNASCRFDYGECESLSDCGNAVVEADEVCDDGTLNGTYGHCADANSKRADGTFVGACLGAHSQYCGNGAVDFNDKDGDGVKDANEASLEFCDTATPTNACSGLSSLLCDLTGDPTVPMNLCLVKLYSDDYESQGSCNVVSGNAYNVASSTLTCARDCQGPGSYCGDGEVDFSFGEQCDDGNKTNGDGCNIICKLENFACKNAAPMFTTTTNKTRIYVNKYVSGDRTALSSYGAPIEACYSPAAAATGDAICGAYGLSCDGSRVSCSENLDVRRASVASATGVAKEDVKLAVVCAGVYALPPPPVVTSAGRCGDGVVQSPNADGVAEACDLGAQNGIACSPSYGASCTYCSADCGEILSVSAAEFCGDRTLQKQYEACDVFGSSVVSACLEPSFKLDFGVITGYDGFTRALYDSAFDTAGSVQEAISNICNDAIDFDNKSTTDEGIICTGFLTAMINNTINPDNNQHDMTNIKNGRCSDDPSIYCENDLDCAVPASAVTMNLRTVNWLKISPLSTNLSQYGTCEPTGLYQCSAGAGGRGLLSCADEGVVSCANCSLDVDCVSCTKYTDGTGARPYLNILNPMIGNNATGSMEEMPTYLLRPTAPAGFDTYLGRSNLVDDKAVSVAVPLLLIEPIPAETIQTSNYCANEYKVFLNEPQLSGVSTAGGEFDRAQTLVTTDKADFFDYPVNGEDDTIDNEMIVSPAVPNGSFRFVVRWSGAEDAQNVKFSGILYSDDFAGTGNDSSIGYTQAETDNQLCNRMKIGLPGAGIFYGHWVPESLPSPDPGWPEPYKCRAYAETAGNLKPSIFVHAFGSLTDTFAHSITLGVRRNAGGVLQVGSPIAFFVEAISIDPTKRMFNYATADTQVAVDVYSYHEGQVPLYSLYMPTSIFKLAPARHTSTNKLAKYWHVLNLVKNAEGRYEIQPIREPTNPDIVYENGTLETSFDEILANIQAAR